MCLVRDSNDLLLTAQSLNSFTSSQAFFRDLDSLDETLTGPFPA